MSLILTVALIGGVEGAPDVSDGRGELQLAVTRLLEGLDAETRRERVRAQKELLDLGPAVLPLLPPLERLSDASVRESVRRIRHRLERLQASRSVEASKVALAGDMTLAEAAQRITEQTGNSIELAGLPQPLQGRKFTFELLEQSFWEAMDAVCREAGLEYSQLKQGHSLLLQPRIPPKDVEQGREETSLGRAYWKSFRIRLLSANRRQLFGDSTHDLLRFRLEVMVEPRLRPLFLKYTGTDITVRRGKTLLAPLSPQASQELPLSARSGPILIQADFKLPRVVDLSEVELTGRLLVQTAAGSESFIFRDLRDSANISRRNGGVTVSLRTARFEQRAAGLGARLRVSVSYDTGGPAFESHRGWVFHNQAVLQSADGRRTDPTGPITTLLQTDGAVLVEYNFEQLKGEPQDYSFVYAAPTLIVDVPVEFDFPKIPVPLDVAERTLP